MIESRLFLQFIKISEQAIYKKTDSFFLILKIKATLNNLNYYLTMIQKKPPVVQEVEIYVKSKF